MFVFFDTEFTDLTEDSKLISIGCVTADGHSFYAELSDTYQLKNCSDFTVEYVLPLLEGGTKALTEKEVASQLRQWLLQFDDVVTLVTDSEAWDWPWLSRLLAYDVWPSNVHKVPLGMPNSESMLSVIESVQQNHPELAQHHALHDAKVNALAWEQCYGNDISEPQP